MKRILTPLLAAGLLLTTAGCRKDLVYNNDGNGPETTQTDPERQSYIRVTFATDGSYRSRATTENPTEGEKRIYDFRIYVFDKESGVLEQVLEASGMEQTAPVSKTFAVKAGAKKFVTLANFSRPKNEIEDKTPAEDLYPAVTTNATTLDELLAKTVSVKAIAQMTGNSGWRLMLASRQPLEVTVSEQAATAADAQPVDIPVGPLTAKVTLILGETNNENIGYFTHGGTRYKLMQMPKTSYIVRKEGDDWTTPDDADNGEGEASKALYANGVYTGGDDYTTKTPSYMPDNRHTKPTAGNSTYMIIKGTFYPNKVYDHTGTTPWYRDDKQSGGRYWENEGGGGNTTKIENLTAFWAIFNKETHTLADSRYFHEEPDLATLFPENSDDYESVKYSESVESGKIEPISYYRVWMGDFSQQEPSKRYTVDRTKHYKITVNGINGPGYNTEKGLVADSQGNKPLETDKNLDITVEVADWNDEQIDVEM